NDLRVGRFTVVFVAEPAAHAPHAWGQFVHAQKPATNIHLMNALIAEVAATVIPKPMPVVMELLAPNWNQRGRTGPQVVIYVGRGRLRLAYFADAAARLVAQTAGDEELAQIAGANPFHGFLDGETGSALRARLDDPVMLARGLHDLAAFP